MNFPAIVLRKLTSILPKGECAENSWENLCSLQLADSNYHQPVRIDCILGADVYPAIILPGLRKGCSQQPVAQNTGLGWVVTDCTPINPTSRLPTCHSHFTTAASLDSILSRFWEIEEVDTPKFRLSQEDKACEAHFVRTYARDEKGRYVLRLPFSQMPHLPGSQAIDFYKWRDDYKPMKRYVIPTANSWRN